MATNQSATEILVVWDPPEPANGIIIQYIIRYYRVTVPGDVNETSVSRNNTGILVGDLLPFTAYTFLVSAVTVDEGPEAEANATTSEAGLLSLPYYVILKWAYNHIGVLTWSKTAEL